MAGRIITHQTHPFGTITNYAALVAVRCNVDVQDMRRVLPPIFWMSEEELELNLPSRENNLEIHGAYPPRVKDCSLGAQENWGFFKYLATTELSTHQHTILNNWSSAFTHLSRLSSIDDDDDDDEHFLLKAASAKGALATFVDAHNTGYYVNSYTTKLNPTMDGVLQRLMDGIKRLNSEWRIKDIEDRALAQGEVDPNPGLTKRRGEFRRCR